MRMVLSFMLVMFLLGVAAVGVSIYDYKNSRSVQAITLVVAPSTGARALLHQLHDAKLAPHPYLTLVPMLLNANYHLLKAGEYEFAAGSTPLQVIDKIARGEVVVHKITIPEGWNSFQLREALMKEPLLTGELPAHIAEGSVLPDTMHFQRGEERVKVLERMQKAQREMMETLWPTRNTDVPVSAPEEAIALASVIEKETGVNDERGMVAGVFVNRLHKGMMLQSDPTVSYGIEVAQGGVPMGHALTRGDLQRDTPYNTYTRVGLPPTPICNPGRAAIDAALHPAATDALYFVATGKGGHHFAATLEEHSANVAAYHAVLRAAASAASVPAKSN